MKKFLITILLIAGLLCGGYVLLLFQLKQSAIAAIEDFNRTSQSTYGNSEFIYNDIRFNLFRRLAIIEKPVFRVSGKQIFIAEQMEVSRKSKELEFLNLTNMNLTLEYDDVDFELSASNLQVEEFNFSAIENFSSDFLNIDALKIGKFEIKDFLIKGKGIAQEELIIASGNLLIEEVSDETAEKIRIEGSIKDNSKILANVPYQFEARKIELLELDLKSIVRAVSSDKTEFLVQINDAFGRSKLDFEETTIFLPQSEIKASIQKGVVEIDENIVEKFFVEDFIFENMPKDLDILIAEFDLDGLNLGMDISDEEKVLQTISQLFGVRQLRLKDVSISSKDFPIYFEEFQLSDIITEAGLVVSGKSILSKLEVPLIAFSVLDDRTARNFSNVLGKDKVEVSFRNQFEYQIEQEQFQYDLSFALDELAELNIKLELGSFDLDMFKNNMESHSAPLITKSAKDIEIKQVQFEYKDLKLANILFDAYPEIARGYDLLQLQATLLLLQYPIQQKSLVTALNDFQSEKNKLGFSLNAKKVLKISGIPELFMSGQMAEYALIEFYGK